MTIATLLGHFGIHVPRYVTLDGQIVVNGVANTGSGGYAHADHGSVTPIANHTFHGGEEAPDDDAGAPTPWWEEGDSLARHIRDMAQCFPKFTFVPADANLAPCWVGEIDTGRGKFKIGVVLRRDQGLPTVRVLGGRRLGIHASGRWMPAPHLYLNGYLCVADRSDWNPGIDTAATATAWAAHWLAAYTEWRITRRWPVEGVQSSVA